MFEGLVSATSLRHFRSHVLRVDSLQDGILDTREDGPEGIDTKDHVEMLVVLQLYCVNHLNVLLVSLDTLHQRLAEHEVINVTVKDRVGREASWEPRFRDTRVKDATTVGEARHVPVEKLGRGRDGDSTEDLGLLTT